LQIHETENLKKFLSRNRDTKKFPVEKDDPKERNSPSFCRNFYLCLSNSSITLKFLPSGGERIFPDSEKPGKKRFLF